jgi:hypothetical protein
MEKDIVGIVNMINEELKYYVKTYEEVNNE